MRGRARLSGSVKFPRRDRGTGHEGELQMNQRTSWVSHAVAALAMLATVAFVPTDAAAQPPGPPTRVICCIPENGTLECGQLTADNCARHPGAFSIGTGSCAHNPCLTSSTTTSTTPVTTSSTSTSTSTSTSSSTSTTLACCGSSTHNVQPTQLSFTTGIGTGNCGTLQSSTGSVLLNLACGGLYTGGGGNSVPLPYAVPDMGQSFTKVTACS